MEQSEIICCRMTENADHNNPNELLDMRKGDICIAMEAGGIFFPWGVRTGDGGGGGAT